MCPTFVSLSFSEFLNIRFFNLTRYCIFRMFFSCNNILILNFKKCKNFPLGPLKKYISPWLYYSTLSIAKSLMYPPMVLSNQSSTTLDTMLSTLLALLISIDVQTIGGLSLISNWVSANLASHSDRSL
jgi:hypothetical protein